MDGRPFAVAPFAVLQDGARFLLFERPIRVEEAAAAAGVAAALRRVDAALAEGLWVAGFLAYEAALAWGLPARPPDPADPPLLWFGVFARPREVAVAASFGGGGSRPSRFTPALDEGVYGSAVARIHDRIAAGDTYQVNFTFPLEGPLLEEPWDMFARLVAAQRPRHAAFFDLGRFAVASASPELFFRREEGRLTARPSSSPAPPSPGRRRDGRSRSSPGRRRDHGACIPEPSAGRARTGGRPLASPSAPR